MTNDELERLKTRVHQAVEITDRMASLAEQLDRWERLRDEESIGIHSRSGLLSGLSRAAFNEIKKAAQTDLQKQIDAARKNLADL